MKMFWPAVAGAAAVVLAAVGPAAAADLAPPPVYKAPIVKAPVAPVHDWSGWYAGGNAGYGWGPWTDTTAFGGDPRGDSWIAGVQGGYNWQFDHRVFGLEGDFQLTGHRAAGSAVLEGLGATVFSPSGLPTTTQTADVFDTSWKLPWFGTFRARGGFTADNWLFYGTGGLAVGEVRATNTHQFVNTTAVINSSNGATITTNNFTLVGSTSESAIRAGWAIGAGIEHAFALHWTAKLEYLYVDLGTATLISGPAVPTDVRLRDQIARLGFNYEFGH
jgi:outer membrane immunogenic protein